MARIPAAERRAELVAAAVRVIAAHGMDGATTRRIAEEAGAPLATLHYCFATKEVLFGAVFDYLAGEYRQVLTRNDAHSDVQTTARALLRGLMEWYLENPNFGATIIELISWGQREGTQAKAVYTAAFETMRTILGDDPVTASGRAVPPATIDQLIYIVAALSDGFALNWLVFTDPVASAAQMEITLGVLDTWMAGHLGDPIAAPTAVTPEPEPDMRSLVSWVKVG